MLSPTPSFSFDGLLLDYSNSSSAWTPLYGGGGKLDKDAIQLIHKFYCKDCQMEEQAAERARAQSSSKAAANSPYHREPTSPVLDQHSLTQSLDKNKEYSRQNEMMALLHDGRLPVLALKRKLMLRRSVNELVDRGIYPPLSTPPAYAEQRKQLERAKAGDFLRRKIQQRPDRQSLVQQHILEDTTIAPSLQERQRLLKKSRLSDELNEKIAHRPGPLDLIKGNILQTDKMIVDAIKGNDGMQVDQNDGSLSYEDVEGSDEDDQSRQFNFDDDTNTSDGAPSPQGDSNMSEIGSPVPVTLPQVMEIPNFIQQTSPTTSMPQVSKSHQIGSPPIIQQHASNTMAKSNNYGAQNNFNKSRPKRPKPKAMPKAKVIKFHEYKGPPNIVKTQNASDSETPYHINLKQQQLLLQCQLEFQQKNNFLIAPQESEDTLIHIAPQPAPGTSMVLASSASPKPITAQAIQAATVVQTSAPTIQTSVPQQIVQTVQQRCVTPQIPVPTLMTSKSPSPQPVQPPAVRVAVKTPKIYGNLEDLKVADLKVELKKRNLPVSGSKPQLIQRLSPYHETAAKSPVHTVVTPAPSPASSIGTIESIGSPPLAKINQTGKIVNVQSKVKEEPMSRTNSPPTSPVLMDSNPLSPEMMEISMPSLANQPKLHISPNPTPVSIAPTTVTMTTEQVLTTPIIKTEATPMDVDQSQESSNLNAALINQQLQLQMQNFQQLLQKTQQQQPQLTQEELVRQQQSQIEELQRQLQESEMKLKLQSLQQQQIQLQQQQNQMLQQNKIISQPIPSSQPTLINNQANLIASQTPLVNAIQINLRPDTKTPQIQNSQPKQIQIPASLLQQNSIQNNNHSVPAVIVTSNANAEIAKQNKSNLSEYLKLQALQNLKQDVSIPASFSSQPYIFTTATTNQKTIPNQLPINGIHRTTSLPSATIEGQKALERTQSTPFFSVPLKEPPKYDEAIRSKQQAKQKDESISTLQQQSSPQPAQTNLNKSQAMDDVLEILIRHGDLPPNAAEEALPTPKTTKAQPLPSVSPVPPAVTSSATFDTLLSSGINFSAPSPHPTSTVSPTTAITSSSNPVLQLNSDPVEPMPNHIDSPPPPVISMPLSDAQNELLDLTEMLGAGDLNSMEWNNDSTFSGLDMYTGSLGDQLNTPNVNKSFLYTPTTHEQRTGSVHGSEPDLASLDIIDADTEWLNMILPGTGLSSPTTNTSVAFTSDPILTPKTQQEVLELFNFDESDFNTPTDPTSGLNWDKLTDPGTSTS